MPNVNQVIYSLFPPCPLGPLTASKCYCWDREWAPLFWGGGRSSSFLHCSSSFPWVPQLARESTAWGRRNAGIGVSRKCLWITWTRISSGDELQLLVGALLLPIYPNLSLWAEQPLPGEWEVILSFVWLASLCTSVVGSHSWKMDHSYGGFSQLEGEVKPLKDRVALALEDLMD